MNINRTQALVLGFFILAWLSLVVILAEAPEIYDLVFQLPDRSRPVDVGFLVALTVFLLMLGTGVVRRWRWTFWLTLVAFLAGIIRVPAAGLQLLGILAAPGPTWYVLFQMCLGLAQFAIGLAMLTGYRRGGEWASS
jgi:hypothetical protein